ncbi:MAG: PorV/PorQ family protein [Bacteroidales bacterium]|nr:PorV/PorQ family protein [Bacteroidales bacterium]
MKRITKILTLSAALLVVSAQVSYAGNDQRRGAAGATQLLINPWAKSSGWGGVNFANVRGLDAIYSNVAGLAFSNNFEFAYSATMLYGGRSGLMGAASVNTFGLSVRLFESGVLGAYVMSTGFGEIDVTTYDSPEAGTNGTFSPSFMNINIAYAHSFTRSIHGGVVFKVVSESTDNVSASGLAIDAGIQYVTGAEDELKFGISLKNWGPSFGYDGPGHSLTMVNYSGNDFTVETRSADMELPTCLNIGLSYDFLLPSWDQRITIAGSFTSNAFLRDIYTLGVEYSLLNLVELRCAYNIQPGLWNNDAATANSGFCAGGSVNVPLSKKEGSTTGLSIDYSFRTSYNMRGTHAFGASFHF